MNKFDFLTHLRAKLWSIPKEDAERSVEFYSEMIDDRMEEGLSEEEAVAAIGDLDEIVRGIVGDAPAAVPMAEEAPKPHKNRKTWEIVLLILGSPVWVSLLIAAAAVIFSVWISLWSVVISLYAAAVSLGAAAVGCILGSFFMFMQSPAGWLCILLILFAMVATPIAEKKIKAVTDDRYALIHTESIKPLPIPEDDRQPVGTKWGSDT